MVGLSRALGAEASMDNDRIGCPCSNEEGISTSGTLARAAPGTREDSSASIGSLRVSRPVNTSFEPRLSDSVAIPYRAAKFLALGPLLACRSIRPTFG